MYRIVAAVLRRLFPLKEEPPEAADNASVVYICRHGNNVGPLYTFLHMKGRIRPWVFYVFCEERACFEHTYRYTFRERYGMPGPLAWFVARLNAFFMPKIVRSMRSIPVYRSGAKSMLTLRESIKALLNGESILLFPDVDYTSEEGGVGSLYKGFVLLERMFAAKTGRHLPFVPLAVKPRERIAVGEPVLFDGDGSDGRMMDDMVRRLGEALERLERTA